jgi:hypothetical protein
MLGADAEGVTLAVEPGITVPVVMLRPGAVMAGGPVVVIVSEQGKGRILTDRRREIEALLKAGFAVCLPDVRGTGESAPDTRRGPQSAGISLAATELMLGNTLLGARLKDLRSVIAWLGSRPIVMWGDSHAPPNPARMMLDELPNWQIGPQIQNQAEPLGGLLAILAAFYERRVRAVAVHRGLASYRSILEDNFAYVPADIIVPGILEAGDIADVAAALAPTPVVLDEMVDGRNRLVPGARRGIDIAAWIIGLPSPR